MTDTTDKTKDFLNQVLEEARAVYPNLNNENYLHYALIQLTGKVFQLEEKLKELNDERRF